MIAAKPSRAVLGRKRLIERLRAGAVVHVLGGFGDLHCYIDQEGAPPLTVRYDSAFSLQREGLLRSTADSQWAMSYDLVPTDAFWGRYPKKGVECPKCHEHHTHWCLLVAESPHWHCDGCGHRWYENQDGAR